MVAQDSPQTPTTRGQKSAIFDKAHVEKKGEHFPKRAIRETGSPFHRTERGDPDKLGSWSESVSDSGP